MEDSACVKVTGLVYYFFYPDYYSKGIEFNKGSINSINGTLKNVIKAIKYFDDEFIDMFWKLKEKEK